MITEFDKAIVALVMAVLVVVDQIWGISIGGLTEEAVTVILTILSPILVWLVPNRARVAAPHR